MFKWLNNQGVESDRGFSVQSLDRFTIEYREGTKGIRISVDNGILGDQPCVSIEATAFSRWDGTPSDDALPADKQAAMLLNFREAMEFQGIAVVVQ